MSRRKKGYWTYERCSIEALKYSSRSKFRKQEPGAYVAALKGGFYESIITHMKPQANGYIRYMYAIEFNETKSVYVGITNNINRRKWQHYNNSSNRHVREYLKKHKHEWVTFDEKLNKDNAGACEDGKIKYYTNNGWAVLNTAKAGSLGGVRRYWTKKRCNIMALKCGSKKEFYTKYKSAYQASVHGGWLNEMCEHMSYIKRPNGFWNSKDKCLSEAKKYNSIKEFMKNAPSAYKYALKKGWSVGLFERLVKPVGFWTKDICLEEALKYKTRTEFQNGSKSAYASAQRNGWLNDMYNHMAHKYKEDGHWSIEKCRKEALKYKSRTEFSIKSGGAYNAAKKNGWLNAICIHLPKKKPCILN